jgi:hypothetical protein
MPEPDTKSVGRFYDDLSAHFHLVLEDWDASVVRQGPVLDRLIAESLGPGPKRVLDADCGIGTQAIGLALRGHQVTAVLDNALAHLLSREDLTAAFGALAATLEAGGLFLASTRDYERLIETRPAATPIQVFEGDEGRRLVFQTWDWDAEGSGYDQTLYILRHRPDGLETLAFKTRSRAWTRADLDAAAAAAGFVSPRWSEPEESGFYQPILTARRP